MHVYVYVYCMYSYLLLISHDTAAGPLPRTAERIVIQDQLAARLDVQGHVVQRLLKCWIYP